MKPNSKTLEFVESQLQIISFLYKNRGFTYLNDDIDIDRDYISKSQAVFTAPDDPTIKITLLDIGDSGRDTYYTTFAMDNEDLFTIRFNSNSYRSLNDDDKYNVLYLVNNEPITLNHGEQLLAAINGTKHINDLKAQQENIYNSQQQKEKESELKKSLQQDILFQTTLEKIQRKMKR